MSQEAAALEQSAPVVSETADGHVAEVAAPVDNGQLLVDLTLARIAQDHGEVARLNGLLNEPKPAEAVETQTETVVEPSAEETAAKAAEEAKIEESGDLPTQKDPSRFRFHTPEDKAIALMAKDKKISLAEAAKIYLGEPKKEEVVQQTAPVVDQNIVSLEANVAAIEEALDAEGANEGLVNPAITALVKQLSKANAVLEATRMSAKTLADARSISQTEREAETQAQFDKQVDEFKADMAKAYPALADRSSPLAILADGYATAMQDPAHPDHAEIYKPSVIRFLAEKAAKALNLQPVGAKAPSKAKPAEVEPARPAPGSRASSIPAPAATEAEIIAQLKERALKAVAGGHFTGGMRSIGGVLIT